MRPAPRRPYSPLRALAKVVVFPLWIFVFCLIAAMAVAHRIGTGEWPSKEGCYS